MKKIIVSLGIAFAAYSFAQAQTVEQVTPFSKIAIGVELFSTTGFGLEVATPLHKNFALRGGITLFPLKRTFNGLSVDLDQSTIDDIDNKILSRPEIKQDLENRGLPTSLSSIDNNIEASLRLGLVNGKLLVDYYPAARVPFHLTAGAYFGDNKLVSLGAKLPRQTFQILDVLANHGENYFDTPIAEGEGYAVTPRDLRNPDIAIKTNAVKPYFGLGFGRAVPKNRVGVQFDMGAYFHGTPKLTSSNANIQKMIDAEMDSGVTDILEKLKFWPVMSLRISCRLF